MLPMPSDYGSIGVVIGQLKFLLALTTKAQSLTTWEACETGGRQTDLAQFQQRGRVCGLTNSTTTS